ncbi:MAG: SRPBCC family protein [Candidatus Eremiobacteraeota bacterium]|nr:SRPBCC family protein [Candidatus Eremiobacteraeota bacterium]MCW5870382.1 SRPBCC family protein [Candidatus Eremiobacteraeota bacterium]
MKGEMSPVPSVRFERRLPGPIERVWQYLTDPEKLPEWFGQGTIELCEGGQVSLMDGHIRGIVTQCRPPHLLIYTWNVLAPGQTVSDYPESYLKLELEALEDGQILLTLTHLPILKRFEKQNAMGWHTFLDLMENGVRGGPLKSRRDFMQANASLYGVDLTQLAK